MLVAAVDAADAAGGENGDRGQPARGERRADGRRTECAVDDAGGQVARAHLASLRARRGDPLELLVVEPDAKRAVEDGDRRRHRAAVAHALLALPPDREPLAWREAVRDDGRLQGDDGPSRGQCLLDLT